MKFKELKQYFETAKLPRTITKGYIHISNVKETAERYIYILDCLFKTHGKDVNFNPYAITLLNGLKIIHDMTKDKNLHNKEGLPHKAFTSY